jgi:hypothetical protein
MDAVTYPNERVQSWLREHWIACRLPIAEEKELARRFGVLWTPGLVWLDAEGAAHHTNVGYFEPNELLAESCFGAGMVAAGSGDWEAALSWFETVDKQWQHSHAAPAAKYWAGVAAKMWSGDVEPLLAHWRNLIRLYGSSSWAEKVSFIDN